MIASKLQSVILATAFGLGIYSNYLFAHALPGSSLTFSHKNELVKLSISFTLEDLIIAAPEFSMLQDTLDEPDISKANIALLAKYFNQHLQLEHNSKNLAYTLDTASILMAQNHDIGSFTMLVFEFSFPTDKEVSVFPIRLKYDAVMHEVRSHRADVYWSEPDEHETPIRITSFRFNAHKGDRHGILLNAPEGLKNNR